MSGQWVYGSYLAAGLVALAVYVGLPKHDRPPRRGLFFLLLSVAVAGLWFLSSRLLAEGFDQPAFYVLTFLSVGGAIRVVTHPTPVYSALYFVLVVLSTAAMIILVGAEFLGAALVIVYAGAILVTYVFVIMLAQPASSASSRLATFGLDYDRRAREPGWSVLAGFVLIATVSGMLVRREWPKYSAPAASELMENNTLEMGKMLMTDFAISVELAGVLLMVAMIGAIAIARRRIPPADEPAEAPPPGEVGRQVKPF